MIRRWHH